MSGQDGGAGAQSRPTILRVHGVGGDPPEVTLAAKSVRELALVAGAPPTGFWARWADRSTVAYSWGRLTSGSGTFALWLVLLPFTLANVAGWTIPERGPGGRRRVPRVLVHLLAALLSASWVVWAAVVLLDLVAFQWLDRVALPVGDRGRVVIGSVLVAAAAAVVVVIAGVTQRRYERVGSGRAAGERERWAMGEALAAQTFFDHPASAARVLVVHATVMALALAAVVAHAFRRAADPSLDLGGWVSALMVAEAAVLVALAVVVPRGPAGAFRLRPTAVVGALAFAFLHGFYGGLSVWAQRRLEEAGEPTAAGPGLTVELAGELALVDILAVALVAAVAVGAVQAVRCRWWAVRPDAVDVAEAGSGLGAELDGVPGAAFRTRIARSRGIATLGPQADLALTAGSVALLVAMAAALATRLAVPEGAALAPWRWSLDPRGSFTVGAVGTRGLAEWALPLTALFAVGLVQRLYSRPGLRRTVGIAWDVLSFWPRRYHPLAVRPYSERAVPEMRAYLERATRTAPVVVLAHSQGSVLAYAALASSPDHVCRRVALVTFGAPLGKLYGPVFPAFFDAAGAATLRARLASPGEGLSGWRNFYRLTDPIGGPVFPAGDADDRCLDDPATGPAVSSRPEADHGTEPPRQPWASLAIHSYYLNEADLRDWVERVRAGMMGG